HGDSATPRGDYSIGAHAAVIRDLLALIGVERASMLGHSLGGGIAMQFFYQFPQRTERLILVSSGGLGHRVSPILRTAAMPGAPGGGASRLPPHDRAGTARGRRLGGPPLRRRAGASRELAGGRLASRSTPSPWHDFR